MSTEPLVKTLRGARSWNRPLMVMTGVMLVAALGCVIGLVADDRVLLDAPIWLKPFKFAVSIALYSVAWAWMISLLPKRSKVVSAAAWTVTTVLAVEYVIIVVQVIRGKRSHFNVQTPFDSAMFSIMGASIAVLWVATLLLSIVALRHKFGSRADTIAVRAGVLIAMLGISAGFLMIGPTSDQLASMKNDTFQGFVGAHSVGVPDGGPGLPATDWSTTGGDLRVPHFVGMHALQFFPLLAIALLALATRIPALRPDRVRARLIVVAGAGYTALLGLLTWQAERGQPLVHPDGLTLGAFALIVVGVVAGTAWSLRAPATAGADELELVAA
jgi:hypothetical protein